MRSKQEVDKFIDEASSVLQVIIKAMVDNPTKTSLMIDIGENTIQFITSVDKSDTGQIIGKQGNNAAAIRNILTAMAAKHGFRAVLVINE
jgi:hypothetical protein